MKEREIREILEQVCRTLDARAAVVPAVAGALSLAAGCGGEAVTPPYMAPPPEDGGEDVKADQQDAVSEDGPSIVYMAPVDAGDEDAGAIPPYMAVPPDAGDEDAGAIPPYMAVPPDSGDEDVGVMPPYMGAPPDYDQ